MSSSVAPKPLLRVERETPAVQAARMLGGLLATCQQDQAHRERAAVDLRAVEDIQRKLQTNPDDQAAKQWVRQLAQSWSFRVRDNTRSIRRILDLINSPNGARR